MRELTKYMPVEQLQFSRRGFLIGSATGVATLGLTSLGIRPTEAQTRALLNSKEVTNLFTLEEKMFEGALGPSWSNAWQDPPVSGNWRRLYDIGILERSNGDGRLSFVPVLKQLWDKGAGSLLESGQYGISIPSPQSVSEFSVPKNLSEILTWLRGIAETGPIRAYVINKQERTVVATDSVALLETPTGEQFFLPIGRLAKAPELEIVPSTIEVFSWPERFGDLERDGIEFINVKRKDGKPSRVGLSLGDPELYPRLLWVSVNFAEHPSLKHRILFYGSYQQLRDESGVPINSTNAVSIPWDAAFARQVPMFDENSNYLGLKEYPPTFKDGEYRWRVTPDGVVEHHMSLPEPLEGATPDVHQIAKLSMVNGVGIPILDMILSNPDGSYSVDGISRFRQAEEIARSPEMQAHQLFKRIPIQGFNGISPFKLEYLS